MQKNAVSKVVRTVSKALPSLLEYTEVLTAFIDLIETVDKLPDMEQRFHAEGMSLYQGISKGLTQSELENGLHVFFGEAVKPAGAAVSASVEKSPSVELLGEIQTDQTLFIKHAGDAEFYGTLWPWPKKENVITVHLGISTRGMPGETHQAMYDAIKEYMTQNEPVPMDSSLSGRLQGVSLPSFLQMSEMEGSTCTLKIRSGQEVGTMHILEGKLIDAETKNLRHKEAAYAILCWDNTEIEILKSSGRKKNEIGLPLMHILMEALKKKDEGDYEKSETPLDTPLEMVSEKEEKAPPPEIHTQKKPAVKPAAAKKKPVPKKKVIKKQPSPATPDIILPEAGEKDETPPPETTFEREIQSGLEMPLKKAPQRKTVAVKKKSKQKGIVIAGVVVLVLCFGLCWFLWGAGGQSVDVAFADLLTRLDETENPAAQEEMINAFIRDYSKEMEFTDRAKKKLAELRVMHEDSAFENASRTVFKLPLSRDYRKKAEGIFDDFLKMYPESRYREEIARTLAKFSDLTDDTYFSELSDLDPRDYIKRLKAYHAYLEDYPEGSHRAEVEQLVRGALNSSYKEFQRSITKCERKEDWDGCLDVCREYRAVYGSYLRMDEVDQIESRMREQKALGILKDRVKDADDETIRKLYLAFVTDYPDTVEKKNFLEIIAGIEKKLAIQNEWVALQTHSRDEKIPLTERVAKIRHYIDKNPSGSHMIEAENLLWQLEQPVQTSGSEKHSATSGKSPSGASSQASTGEGLNDETEQKSTQQTKRLEGLRKKTTADLQKTDGRFRGQGDGTVLDTVTGLVWSVLDSRQVTDGCLNHNEARKYVSELTDGGHNDWRIPTSAELAGIYKSKPYFPPGNTEWYWSSETYSKGYQNIANIVTTRQETEYRKKSVSVEKCGAVRAVRP